jgi:hypothetical protein
VVGVVARTFDVKLKLKNEQIPDLAAGSFVESFLDFRPTRKLVYLCFLGGNTRASRWGKAPGNGNHSGNGRNRSGVDGFERERSFCGIRG